MSEENKHTYILIDNKWVRFEKLPCFKCNWRYSYVCPKCVWNATGKYNTYGGEPFKYSAPNEIAEKLKRDYKNIKAVYVYTNAVELGQYIVEKDSDGQFNYIDGVNVSIKCKADADAFLDYIVNVKAIKKMKSNLLYVFDNLLPKGTDVGNFVWKDRTWQPDFKPASDSIFRRI